MMSPGNGKIKKRTLDRCIVCTWKDIKGEARGEKNQEI